VRHCKLLIVVLCYNEKNKWRMKHVKLDAVA
jgi:hypothetical protein